MNARTTKASRQMQISPDSKAFCHQQSSQPSKLVSIEQSTNVLDKLLDGRYQVVQVLGAGGFSQTYLAQDIHKPSKPTCVVKHFKPASSDPSFIRTAQYLFHFVLCTTDPSLSSSQQKNIPSLSKLYK